MQFFALIAAIFCLLHSSYSSQRNDLSLPFTELIEYQNDLANAIIAEAPEKGFDWELIEKEKVKYGPQIHLCFLFRLLERISVIKIKPSQFIKLAQDFVAASEAHPEAVSWFDFSKLEKMLLNYIIKRSALEGNLPIFKHLYRSGLVNLNEKWNFDISAVVDKINSEPAIVESTTELTKEQVGLASQNISEAPETVRNGSENIPSIDFSKLDYTSLAYIIQISLLCQTQSLLKQLNNAEPFNLNREWNFSSSSMVKASNNEPPTAPVPSAVDLQNSQQIPKLSSSSASKTPSPSTIDLTSDEAGTFTVSSSNYSTPQLSRGKKRKFDLEVIESSQKKPITIDLSVGPSTAQGTLPKLPEDTDLLLDLSFSAPPDKELSEVSKVVIKSPDLLTLKKREWLNDQIINFYLEMIQERSQGSVHVLSSFFYLKLSGDGYQEVRSWTSNVDVFAKDKIFIPIHLPGHWCMAEINIPNRKIIYYDSLGGANHTCLFTLLNWLIDEHIDKKKSYPSGIDDWQLVTADSPRQKNGCDCGVFACVTAEYRSRNAPLTFSQADMPYFRKRIAYEILTRSILH